MLICSQPGKLFPRAFFFAKKQKKGFNGERGILGRQKVVCGSNAPASPSHAGPNPRSCTTLSLAASFVSGKSRLVTRRNGELLYVLWYRRRQSRGGIDYLQADRQASLTAVSRPSIIRCILHLFCAEYYHCTYTICIYKVVQKCKNFCLFCPPPNPSY